MEPIKFKPFLKEYIWGGGRMESLFGYEKGGLANIGEAWVLSAHRNGQSVAVGGTFSGRTLGDILCLHPDFTGSRAASGSGFPQLIKFIDARENLSVQVHPSDEYAHLHENSPGKTEMWVVLSADPGAFIYLGFDRDITKDEFVRRIGDGTLIDVLNRVKVQKGDCYLIEAGTIHAIGAGIMVAEIQQNSDVTYRVYDYNRVGADGQPRELHLQKAADVVNRKKYIPQNITGEKLAQTPYFTVDHYVVKGEKVFDVGSESFMAVLCLNGNFTLRDVLGGSVEVKTGDCVFLPAGIGECKMSGTGEILTSAI